MADRSVCPVPVGAPESVVLVITEGRAGREPIRYVGLVSMTRQIALVVFAIGVAIALLGLFPHHPPPCDNGLPWLACKEVGR
jgi:hypothetical protein